MITSWKNCCRISAAAVILTLGAALVAPVPAVSQGLTSVAVSKPTRQMDVNAGYDISFGFKPQYFEEPGQYLEQAFSVGFPPGKHVVLTITGSLYSRWQPARETEAGDTLIQLAHNELLKSGPYTILGRASGALPTSPTSREKGLRGRTSGRMTQRLALGSVALLHHVDAGKYFYQHALDATGVSTRDYDVKNTIGLSLRVIEKVNLLVTGAITNRFLHVGPRQDLYESSLALRYAVNANVAVNAGILTSQEQVKDGRRQGIRLYEKDITEAYSGLSFLF